MIDDPGNTFEEALKARPSDDHSEGWRALLVAACVRAVTDSCESAVIAARSAPIASGSEQLTPSAIEDSQHHQDLESAKCGRKRPRSVLDNHGRSHGLLNKRIGHKLEGEDYCGLDHLLTWVDEAIAYFDKVLILAGDFYERDSFQTVIQHIEQWATRYDSTNLSWSHGSQNDHNLIEEIAWLSNPDSGEKSFFARASLPALVSKTPIPRYKHNDERARALLATYQYPLILTGGLADWPAMSTWKSTNYWLRKTLNGRRLLPVEIGRRYTDDDWCLDFMTFKHFIWQLMSTKGSSKSGSEKSDVAYLAQHDIFSQIPSLQRDVMIPDECYLETPDDYREPLNLADRPLQVRYLDSPEKNIWMGPGGTISPLHYDPYHNILCQVVGTKYIRLYAPTETSKLYPRKSSLMRNTSEVDVEASPVLLDASFPNFKEAKYIDGYLRAGEMLWLPKGWWHYVRAIETSISVSFWWS